MGMDNAVVAQRMAEGFEDFWLPSLNSPGHPDRMNYLPLGYWLESQWYNVFGSNSFTAEKVYSVLTYIIIALLMIWIWRLIGMPKGTGWLPVLCWITIPLVTWSATNNLLESTLTIFVLLSVALLFLAGRDSLMAITRLSSGKPAGSYRVYCAIWLFLAALSMELAFMVKGFTGLFPLFFPLLYWLVVRRQKVAYPLFATVVILAVWIVTLFVVVIFSPDAYQHLYNYIHHQMIGGLLHVQTVASRFYIIYVLLLQSIIPLTILALFCLIRIKNRPFYKYMFFWRFRKDLTAIQIEHSRLGWFMLVFGLSGILPIMLGLKQQEFYVVPMLPFFGIAMACLLYDLLEDWLLNINKTAHRVLIALAVLIFGSGLVLNIDSVHKINSNQELLSDMRLILPQLYEGERISVSKEILQMPEVEEYFYRYKNIVFDSLPGQPHYLSMYAVVDRFEGIVYSNLDLPTQQYNLYVETSEL